MAALPWMVLIRVCGMLFSEFRENIHGKVWQQNVVIDEGDLAPTRLGEFMDILQGTFMDVLDGACSIDIDFPGIGQAHFVVFPHEKLCVQPVFQTFQLTA